MTVLLEGVDAVGVNESAVRIIDEHGRNAVEVEHPLELVEVVGLEGEVVPGHLFNALLEVTLVGVEAGEEDLEVLVLGVEASVLLDEDGDEIAAVRAPAGTEEEAEEGSVAEGGDGDFLDTCSGVDLARENVEDGGSVHGVY